jgi:hypothetical protein
MGVTRIATITAIAAASLTAAAALAVTCAVITAKEFEHGRLDHPAP